MSVINFKRKEIIAKVVFYGPGLSGKTTNVQQIHALMPPGHRGELTTLPTEQDRTLFFDYVPLNLGDIGGFKTRFQIFTVPGQVFYSSTRRIVLQGTDGVVFVADSSPDALPRNLESLADLRQNLLTYDRYLNAIAFVIQYNKRDVPGALPIEQLERELNLLGVPAFEAVAAEGRGVLETLSRISSLVLTHLKTSIEGKLTRGRRDASMVERFDDQVQSDADLVKNLVGQIADVRAEENVLREYLEAPTAQESSAASALEPDEVPTPVEKPLLNEASSTLSIVDDEDTGSLSPRSVEPPLSSPTQLHADSIAPKAPDPYSFALETTIPHLEEPSHRHPSQAHDGLFGDKGEPHPAVPHPTGIMAASQGTPEFESSRSPRSTGIGDRARGERASVDRGSVDRASVDRASMDRAGGDKSSSERSNIERVSVERVSIERAASEGGDSGGHLSSASLGDARGIESPRIGPERSVLSAFQPGDTPPWEPRGTSSVRSISSVQSSGGAGVVPASMAILPVALDDEPREPVAFAPPSGKPVAIPAGPLEVVEVGTIGRKGNTLFVPLILRDGTVSRPVTLELTLSGREIPGGKPELPSWLTLWLTIVTLVAGAGLALALAG